MFTTLKAREFLYILGKLNIEIIPKDGSHKTLIAPNGARVSIHIPARGHELYKVVVFETIKKLGISKKDFLAHL